MIKGLIIIIIILNPFVSAFGGIKNQKLNSKNCIEHDSVLIVKNACMDLNIKDNMKEFVLLNLGLKFNTSLLNGYSLDGSVFRALQMPQNSRKSAIIKSKSLAYEFNLRNNEVSGKIKDDYKIEISKNSLGSITNYIVNRTAFISSPHLYKVKIVEYSFENVEYDLLSNFPIRINRLFSCSSIFNSEDYDYKSKSFKTKKIKYICNCNEIDSFFYNYEKKSIIIARRNLCDNRLIKFIFDYSANDTSFFNDLINKPTLLLNKFSKSKYDSFSVSITTLFDDVSRVEDYTFYTYHDSIAMFTKFDKTKPDVKTGSKKFPSWYSWENYCNKERNKPIYENVTSYYDSSKNVYEILSSKDTFFVFSPIFNKIFQNNSSKSKIAKFNSAVNSFNISDIIKIRTSNDIRNSQLHEFVKKSNSRLNIENVNITCRRILINRFYKLVFFSDKSTIKYVK